MRSRPSDDTLTRVSKLEEKVRRLGVRNFGGGDPGGPSAGGGVTAWKDTDQAITTVDTVVWNQLYDNQIGAAFTDIYTGSGHNDEILVGQVGWYQATLVVALDVSAGATGVVQLLFSDTDGFKRQVGAAMLKNVQTNLVTVSMEPVYVDDPAACNWQAQASASSGASTVRGVSARTSGGPRHSTTRLTIVRLA